MKTKLSDVMKFFYNQIPTWFFKFQILSPSHFQCPQPCWTYKLFEIHVCGQQVKWTIWNRTGMYIPLKAPDSSSGMTSEHQQNLQCSRAKGQSDTQQNTSKGSLIPHFPLILSFPCLLNSQSLYIIDTFHHFFRLVDWQSLRSEFSKWCCFLSFVTHQLPVPTRQSKAASRDQNSVSHLLI